MPNAQAFTGKIKQELAELTEAINGIIETFRSMKSPLLESQEKVPQATTQLDKISEQTEAAAHQMLDKVETITQRESEVIAGLEQLRDAAADHGQRDRLTSVIGKANKNLDDAYLIMDALQFQDITSQQMSHAASLLEEIEAKLQKIVSAIGGAAMAGTDVIRTKKERVFDPHADLFEKKTNQADVDQIFEKTQND